jgi:arylsulfatase A-like enzyme
MGIYGNIYDKNGNLVPDGVADPAKTQYSEDLFENEAIAFIGENKDKPFFLYYSTQLPHGPLIAPSLGEYKDKPWDMKHKEWAAMVARMDQTVGSIVDRLKELNLLEDTVIMFAGDNGYSQWGYFRRAVYQDDPVFHNKGPWPKGKFTCTHEGGMRVPFFVYWKNRVAPGESDHVCTLYDILATLALWADS